MIEIDLIKKHGKKALGMSETSHEPRGWRARAGEVLLEIGIIVFAITLSLWLHNWQEHRHDRARERQFLRGIQQDLADDLREMSADSGNYVQQRQGLRYFKKLSVATLRPDSVKYHNWTLTSLSYFICNSSRFDGLKSTGALGIIEDQALLGELLTYYQRTTVNLTLNAQTYGTSKVESILPYLDLHLRPDKTNLVAVMQEIPMQNYLSHGEAIGGVLRLYHATAQEARKLHHRVGVYLAEH